MGMFGDHKREVPGLNTASLPDLIFSVLFFFMIVTHMRTVTPKVQYKVPQGTELQKLTKKSTVSYIYIGPPSKSMRQYAGTSPRKRVIDAFVSPTCIPNVIRDAKSSLSPEDVNMMP